MDLENIPKEAHAIAKGNGWYDTEVTFEDFILRITATLSKAWEEYHWEERKNGGLVLQVRNNVHMSDPIDKPGGAVAQLASVVIQVADMAEYHGIDISEDVAAAAAEPGGVAIVDQSETFEEWMARLIMVVGLGYWHYQYEQGLHPWSWPMGQVVYGVQRMAEHRGIDLEGAVNALLEYHRTHYPLWPGRAPWLESG